MNDGSLILPTDLGFSARRAFVAEATTSIAVAAGTGGRVLLDCSVVEVAGPLDDAVIGMLVTLARVARRHGARLALIRAPTPMRAQLEAAGVAHFFDWEP